MGLLQPLGKDIGFFKSGWQGPTGSGKTTTASLVAIGLHRHLKLKSPVAFYDSERGSGFIHDLFKYAKIELVGVRSRAFKDLVTFMREAEAAKIDIVIIDSITHPWRELLSAWKQKTNLKFLRIQDWGPIKDEWHRGYSMPYVNSKLHILMCGRQANVFEDVVEDEDQDSGKKAWKAVKVGTKMATEGETGYEPNFLVEMEKRMLREGAAYARVANVIKDRSFRLDGAEQAFDMPMGKDGKPDLARLIDENLPFQFVYPHIESLDPAAGLIAPGVSAASSEEIFNQEGQTQRVAELQEKELLLGNVEQLLHKYYPSRDKISMKSKADIIEGTTWAVDRRTRNWGYIQSKFQPALVKVWYSVIDTLLSPGNREKLEEALAMGLDAKGENILNPDAAPEAVKALAQEIMKKTGVEQGNDLPF